jgi:hypothetical protein
MSITLVSPAEKPAEPQPDFGPDVRKDAPPANPSRRAAAKSSTSKRAITAAAAPPPDRGPERRDAVGVTLSMSGLLAAGLEWKHGVEAIMKAFGNCASLYDVGHCLLEMDSTTFLGLMAWFAILGVSLGWLGLFLFRMLQRLLDFRHWPPSEEPPGRGTQ